MKNKMQDPPQWAIRLLESFCPTELQEGILGDLLEQFDQQAQKVGLASAQKRFIWNVFRLFHPSILFRNHFSLHLMQMAMLKSHLLVALRNMRKRKAHAFINIFGLSFAFAFLFLVAIFLHQELAYDQFHSQKDRIYRLYNTIKKVETGQIANQSAVTAIPLATDLQQSVPAIQYTSRWASTSGVIQQDQNLAREVISFVDSQFLKIFDFPLVIGDKETALYQPNGIILSQEKAKKFFGDENPLNRPLQLTLNDSLMNLVVTGVIDNKKGASSMVLDFMVPFKLYEVLMPPKMLSSYRFSAVESYILLDEKADSTKLDEVLTAAIQVYSPPKENRLEVGIQALGDIHLEAEIVGNTQYTSPQKLYIMVALALLVLVVAFINFITLSTSQALGRLKEMGMRRTLGAVKRQITRQLVIESFLLVALAAVLGLGLSYLIMPGFSIWVDAPLAFQVSPIEGLYVLAVIISITLLSGLLQSAVLLKYDAIQALKGKVLFTGQKGSWNEGLIIFQFALSLLLILGAVHIRSQLQFIQQKDLGFDQERLIEIPLGDSPDQEIMALKVERFRNLAQKNSQIISVGASMNNTADPWTELRFEQEDGEKESLFFNQIDPKYLSTMGVKLVEGIDFSERSNNASNSIIVNQALVEHFGWEDPFAQQIPGKNFEGSHQIIGIAKDFHFSSLHQKIEPLILVLDPAAIESGMTGLSTYTWPPNLYQLLVRIGPGELESALSHLETIWKKFNPAVPFEFNFVDEVLAAKYAEEQRWGSVINAASLFGILIAWLGLFGLMQLSVQKRKREIGIRKVLGASVPGIIALLSSKYGKLLLVSIFVSCPVAWLLLRKWLATFSYQIALSPLLFIGISLLVLLLTIGILSLQSYRAAQRNPIMAIKMD